MKFCLRILFIAIITILMIGCEQDPISTSAQSSMENSSAVKDLKIIRYNSTVEGLKKIVTDSKWITWSDGGELKLDCKGDNGQVKLTLNVLEHTISDDAQLSVSMDDEQLSGNFDMLFAPHGITFSSPAILNIDAKNLDLSGVNPDDINIYYDNQETGEWEVMQSQAIVVNISSGVVKIIDAELPHFSRYAIGLE